MKILVINGGSSSVKATLYNFEKTVSGPPSAPLWEAQAEWGREPGHAEIKAHGVNGGSAGSIIPVASPADVLRPLLATLWSGPAQSIHGPEEIDAIGHRVVHGGSELVNTIQITPAVKAQIEKCAEFAPEHNRLELSAMEAAEQIFGARVPQVAVFDTSFHQTLEAAAKIYAIPFAFYEKGIRRYGFHGISHQYTSRRAAEILGAASDLRLVTCHLGNGASLAAIRGGRCVDTTMGFTPLEGLMMGTRSGSLDPGILIYLLRHAGLRRHAPGPDAQSRLRLEGRFRNFGRYARDPGCHGTKQ